MVEKTVAFLLTRKTFFDRSFFFPAQFPRFAFFRYSAENCLGVRLKDKRVGFKTERIPDNLQKY